MGKKKAGNNAKVRDHGQMLSIVCNRDYMDCGKESEDEEHNPAGAGVSLEGPSYDLPFCL
jgi:hypothetical protein